MRIHHLNCVSACPLGGYLMDGATPSVVRGRLTSHCLLVESSSGLVLVDTGYGLRDVRDPESRLSNFFLFLNRPELREEMTAIRQIERMGFDPRDVRHIVLTHLDFDHAGGLDDFPGATVHMLQQERDAAVARRTMLDRMRYRPQQWSTAESWQLYPMSDGGDFYGFEAVRELRGMSDDILLVPLLGHTLGHAGVAVKGDAGWMFLAGDAYFYHAEMHPTHPHCTPGLAGYQTMMEKDRTLRLGNQERLRGLVRAHTGEVAVICSHDVLEFERVAGRPFDAPAPPSRRTEG